MICGVIESRCITLRPTGRCAIKPRSAGDLHGRDPLKYGYYQFRFMSEALRDRSRLDFAKMVAGKD